MDLLYKPGDSILYSSRGWKVSYDASLVEGGSQMDAILGRYRARMEETGLILRHSTGISFDLTPEETLALLDFLHAYRQTLQTLCQSETEPRLESVVLDKKEPKPVE